MLVAQLFFVLSSLYVIVKKENILCRLSVRFSTSATLERQKKKFN